MTSTSDPYWDELGIAWCAIDPKVEVIMPRLKARLRRQSLLIMAALMVGLPLGLLGVALGVYTILAGWWSGAWFFVTRGIAIAIISVLVLYAWSLLRPVGAGDTVRATSELISLAIARAERTLMVIRLGYLACGVAAVFGVAGVAIRTSIAEPPQLSPVIPLGLIAVLALGLFLYGREVAVALAKFRHLRRALDSD